MGNTCKGQSLPHLQITHLQFRKQNSKCLAKRLTQTDRFLHQVQKLKIDGNNMYKLILPVSGQRQQIKSIQCRFLFSFADMQMCQEYQFRLDDMVRFPIIDAFQPQLSCNPQIYHKITTSDGRRKLMKYCNFSSFCEYEFKRSLYQLHLYIILKSKSPLDSYFIIYRGQVKQLVMIFKYSYMSLHDVLYYRRVANYEWQQRELLLIMKMLCESYMELSRLGIVHRDIRPSNILFSPMPMINSGEVRGSQTNNLDQSRNSNRFYEFCNLQSARIFDEDGFQGADDKLDILTVKGVPVFTEKSIRSALERDESKVNYNPIVADIAGLKQTLLSLVNLQTTNIQKDSQLRLRDKKKVQTLLTYLSNNKNLTIQKIDSQISSLLGIGTTSKSPYYYNILKQFYIKQLTICQNIETNLYFNGAKYSTDQPSLAFPPTSILNVSETKEMRKMSLHSYLQNLYIKTVYDLQKKDVFVPYMLQKLGKNFQANKKQQNVQLLMKVGQYFQESNVRQNQYYKQAALLLIELAEQERTAGFFKDHSKYITQADQVFKKFSTDSKIVIRVKCMLLKEKAYQQLYDAGVSAPQILNIEVPHESDRGHLVRRLIHQSYQLASKANIPFQEQLQLIYAKGQLSLLMKNLQQSQTSYLTGYQLAQKNYKQFKTLHNNNKYKGMFQYALAVVQLNNVMNKKVQRTPRNIFNIEQKLQKAQQRFANVSIHPIHVIKCYIAIGDLNFIRQDYQKARQTYQRALNLVHAENCNTKDKKRTLSARTQLEIVEKLINVLNRSRNQIESIKYEKLHDALRKQFGRSRKNQRRYTRGGRPSEKQSKSSRQHEKMHQLQIIREQEDENKMLQASIKIQSAIYNQDQSSNSLPNQNLHQNQSLIQNQQPNQLPNTLLNEFPHEQPHESQFPDHLENQFPNQQNQMLRKQSQRQMKFDDQEKFVNQF